MAWESESKSRRVGTIDTDSNVGGGSQNFSGAAETLAIKARGETWFIGVQNETTAAASDLFIGLGDDETTDNKLHIQNDGKVGLGTSVPTQELDVNGTINCSGLIVNGSNFSALSTTSVWSGGGSNISYTAGTVTVGDGSSNKRDFKVFGNSTSNHIIFDASADSMTATNMSAAFRGGNLTVTYTSAGGDVTFDSANSDSDFKWDATGGWNGDTGLTDTANSSPSLFLGDDISTGNKGVDFAVMGDTATKYMWWDASDNQLKITGTLDISGTANFDAVDIDGAVQIDNTVTVGIDGTGHDIVFNGDTSGSNLTWDQSADSLIINSSSNGASTWNGGSLILNSSGVGSFFSTTGSVLNFQANNEVFLSSADNIKTVFSRSPVHIGSSSAQIDFKIFGTDSGLLFYDVSNPTLDIDNTFVDMDLTNHAFDLDTTSGAISMTTTTGGMTLETTDNSAVTINSASTSSSAAIDINATAGGIDIDAANNITIDTSSGSISLGSGSTTAITLGNATSEVTVADNLKVDGLISVKQSGEATTDDGTTAVSAANIQRRIVKCTPTADRSKAFDSAANLISTLALDANSDSFDFSLINLATDGTSFITLTAPSIKVTLVGSMIVSAQDSAEDAFTSGVGMFRVRRTAADEVTIYRIG